MALKSDFDDSGKSLFFDDYLKAHNISPGESILIDDSEDKEGKINNAGIEYRRIEAVIGLAPELKRITDALNQK